MPAPAGRGSRGTSRPCSPPHVLGGDTLHRLIPIRLTTASTFFVNCSGVGSNASPNRTVLQGHAADSLLTVQTRCQLNLAAKGPGAANLCQPAVRRSWHAPACAAPALQARHPPGSAACMPQRCRRPQGYSRSSTAHVPPTLVSAGPAVLCLRHCTHRTFASPVYNPFAGPAALLYACSGRPSRQSDPSIPSGSAISSTCTCLHVQQWFLVLTEGLPCAGHLNILLKAVYACQAWTNQTSAIVTPIFVAVPICRMLFNVFPLHLNRCDPA